MRPIPILSAAGTRTIEAIARDRTLLILDFDGTLAPIVDARDGAYPRPETRALLRATSLLYPCAVVSGRARLDVATRLEGVPLVAVIGCHGAEPGFGPLDRRLAATVVGWRERLEELRDLPGVELEDKRFSIALHYRRAPDHAAALHRILAVAGRLRDARVTCGKAIVNVTPLGAPTKGDAIQALCRRLGARVAVYVGDDRTDEAAFRAEVVSIAIRVGQGPDSSASYALPSQEAVDDLLRALLAARARQDGRVEWSGLVRCVVEAP